VPDHSVAENPVDLEHLLIVSLCPICPIERIPRWGWAGRSGLGWGKGLGIGAKRLITPL